MKFMNNSKSLKNKYNLFPVQYALVTGATSGLGLSFSKLLASGGVNLILISRNKESLDLLKNFLEKKYNINAFTFITDLSDISSVDILRKELETISIFPEMLINCAGIGYYGDFINISLRKVEEIILVNILSAIKLIIMFLSIRNKKSKSYVLNVSSTFAFRPVNKWAIYSATKAFIFSFSNSLSAGLISQNILVSVLCPGKMITDFDKNSGKIDEKKNDGSDPDFIAQYSLDKLFSGKRIILPGFSTKIKYLCYKYIPLSILKNITDRV
jgi:uncharacterized protein